MNFCSQMEGISNAVNAKIRKSFLQGDGVDRNI